MIYNSKTATQLQRRLEQMGVSATRKPNEDAQTYVDRIISEAPPEAARIIARQGSPVRIPPCECVECLQQFWTAAAQEMMQNVYTKSLSWKDAQKKCNAWVEEITVSRKFLQDAVSTHGNTIMSRWKKRSVAKRAAILMEIFPSIASKKHALLEKNYTERFHEAREAQRNFYLATYLTPEEWVAWDVKQMEIGWLTGKLEVEHCDASVVMYGTEYGQVVQWKEHQAHAWTTVGFPRAQLVLESQALVMGTVRRIVEQILVGVEIQSLSSKWTELVQTGFRRARDEETWAVLSNQGYLWPPTFRTNDILELCRSRLALAQDELWLLQTDPLYMQHTIAAARSMKINAQRIKCGDRFDVHVCQAAVFHPVRRVNEWHDVVAECENLMLARGRYSDKIRYSLALPVDYENAAGCLELRIINVLIMRAEDLMRAIQESPSFEDHLVYTKGTLPNTMMCHPKTSQETPEIFRTDPLIWCLVQMTTHPEEENKLDPAVLFAFLDEIVAVDRSAACRVDSRLLDQVSDLAALWELLRAVRLQRPLARSLNISEAVSIRTSGVWEEAKAFCKDSKVFSGKKNEDEYTTLISLMPKLMAAKMPTGRRDQSWLKQVEESHAALSELWTGFRRSRERLLRSGGMSKKHVDACMAKVSFDKSAEYRQTLQIERLKIMERLRDLPAPLPDDKFTCWPTSDLESPKSGDLTIQASTKVKTRAAEQADREHVTSELSLKEPTTILSTIALNRESLQIFHRMFPSSEDDNEPSSSMVDWRKFVIAMGDAGFASRHNTGSAVTFDNEKGRIVFHKPHPVAKIDFRSLMRMGKRLNKWFGLERESFEAV